MTRFLFQVSGSSNQLFSAFDNTVNGKGNRLTNTHGLSVSGSGNVICGLLSTTHVSGSNGALCVSIACPLLSPLASGMPLPVDDPFRVTATGGTGAYSFAAIGLPPGISLDASTGVLSGTPTATPDAGMPAATLDAFYSVSVTDSSSYHATSSLLCCTPGTMLVATSQSSTVYPASALAIQALADTNTANALVITICGIDSLTPAVIPVSSTNPAFEPTDDGFSHHLMLCHIHACSAWMHI